MKGCVFKKNNVNCSVEYSTISHILTAVLNTQEWPDKNSSKLILVKYIDTCIK